MVGGMKDRKTSYGSLSSSFLLEKKYSSVSLGIRPISSWVLNKAPTVSNALKPKDPKPEHTESSGFAALKTNSIARRTETDADGHVWVEYETNDTGSVFYYQQDSTVIHGQWQRPDGLFDGEDDLIDDELSSSQGGSYISVEAVDFTSLDEALISRPFNRSFKGSSLESFVTNNNNNSINNSSSDSNNNSNSSSISNKNNNIDDNSSNNSKAAVVVKPNELTTTSKDPAVIIIDPTVERMNLALKDPVPIKKDPLPVNKDPITSNKEPSTSNKEPITSNKEPITSNKDPIVVDLVTSVDKRIFATITADSKKIVSGNEVIDQTSTSANASATKKPLHNNDNDDDDIALLKPRLERKPLFGSFINKVYTDSVAIEDSKIIIAAAASSSSSTYSKDSHQLTMMALDGGSSDDDDDDDDDDDKKHDGGDDDDDDDDDKKHDGDGDDDKKHDNDDDDVDDFDILDVDAEINTTDSVVVERTSRGVGGVVESSAAKADVVIDTMDISPIIDQSTIVTASTITASTVTPTISSSINGSNINGSNINGSNINGSSINGSSINGSSMNGSNMNGSSMNKKLPPRSGFHSRVGMSTYLVVS